MPSTFAAKEPVQDWDRKDERMGKEEDWREPTQAQGMHLC